MRTPQQAEAGGYTAREIMAVLGQPGAAPSRSVLWISFLRFSFRLPG